MKNKGREFTSCLTRWEAIAFVCYIPVHIFLLPLALAFLLLRGKVGEAELNFICYAIGAVYMLLAGRRFLRREFDSLCDGFPGCLLEIVICYGLMLLMNLCVNGILTGLLPGETENLNNENVANMAAARSGITTAMAVFLAPIVEELMFRAGVFGSLRRRSRVTAYIVTIVLFSVYHVWAYAVYDPIYWVYILQYIPASYVLCRCYERTDSIWCAVFLHMLINGISLKILEIVGELI